MTRSATVLRILVALAGVAGCVGCASTLRAGNGVWLKKWPELPNATYLKCEGGSKRLKGAWIDSAGTGNRPLKTSRTSHQLHIKPGVVPAGEEYYFALAEVPAPDAGCHVIAMKLSGGNIGTVSDPYTLWVRCKKNDAADDDKCPANYTVYRIEPDVKEIPGAVVTEKWIYVNLPSLSTYALGTN